MPVATHTANFKGNATEPYHPARSWWHCKCAEQNLSKKHFNGHIFFRCIFYFLQSFSCAGYVALSRHYHLSCTKDEQKNEAFVLVICSKLCSMSPESSINKCRGCFLTWTLFFKVNQEAILIGTCKPILSMNIASFFLKTYVPASLTLQFLE